MKLNLNSIFSIVQCWKTVAWRRADLPAYEDLFSDDADKIEKIGNILIQKYEKFKFTPSAHSAITSEDSSEDNDDNVRAAIGEDSDSLYYCLSSGIGI